MPDSWGFVISGYTLAAAVIAGYVARLHVRALRARQRVERQRGRIR